MELENDKKIELKTLISNLNKITNRLETKQKALTAAVRNHAFLLLVYSVMTIFFCFYAKEDKYIITYELLNVFSFIVLGFYLNEYQGRKAKSIVSECNRGYKKYERLVNFVDWQAYRIKQLHSDTDKKVINALERFVDKVQFIWSPSRKGINVYRVITILFITWRMLLALVGIWYFTEDLSFVITRFVEEITIDTHFICIAGVFFLGIIAIWIFYRIVSVERKLKDEYSLIFNTYMSKFTYFCRFIYMFFKCVVIKDTKKEYVEEIQSLLERFSELGEKSISTLEEYDLTSFNGNTISSLSENINHLWYYIDDKLRYTDGGIELDNELVSKNKETILSEVANISLDYSNSQVKWGLIWKVTGDLYCKDWLVIQDLPFIYKSATDNLKRAKIILLYFWGVLSLTLIILFTMWSSLQLMESISVVIADMLLCIWLCIHNVRLTRKYEKLYLEIVKMHPV